MAAAVFRGLDVPLRAAGQRLSMMERGFPRQVGVPIGVPSAEGASGSYGVVARLD